MAAVRELIALLVLAAVIACLAVIVAHEHQTQAYPLIRAAEPLDDQGRPIRVFATCPWTPWALPRNEGVSKA
jgi:hypothetical protein